MKLFALTLCVTLLSCNAVDTCNFLTTTDAECNAYAKAVVAFQPNGQIEDEDGFNSGTSETSASASLSNNFSYFVSAESTCENFTMEHPLGNGTLRLHTA